MNSDSCYIHASTQLGVAIRECLKVMCHITGDSYWCMFDFAMKTPLVFQKCFNGKGTQMM